MKRKILIMLLFILNTVFCSAVCTFAESGSVLFDGDLKNYPSNWNVGVLPDDSEVKAVYSWHDSIRGASVKIDVPANTHYGASAIMQSADVDDMAVALDLTIMITDKTKKEILLYTSDEEHGLESIPLMTITDNSALMIGNTTVSTDYFKFGTWANGHYRIKLYYFPTTGKVGVNIQRLKYAAGTPSDAEWTFTGYASECRVIDGIGFSIDNTTGGNSRTDIFNFSLTKLCNDDVPESMINSKRMYDFDDLDTKTIKNNQTSGFHTSYYGWYTQNTSSECNVGYAEADNKKVLRLFTDGTKYLDLIKYFDLSLGCSPVIEADIKLEAGSAVGLSVRGPQCTDDVIAGKTLISFADGKAMLINSVDIPGFEYDSWFRISLYIDNTSDTPCIKAKLINLDSGDVTEAETEFDFINTIKYINTFKITPSYGIASAVCVDNISFSEKNVHRALPDFEPDSTIYSDEVSFSSPTFNIDKSRSSVILNGTRADLDNVNTDEFGRVKIKLDRQSEPYTMEYKFYNYWGDKAEGIIKFTCPMDSFYDFQYDKSSVEAGMLNCFAKAVCASGKYKKVTMLTILYDLSNNSMHSIDMSCSELSGIPVTVATSVEVPSDNGKYKAVTYLLDNMTDMNSLTKSIELK